MRGKLHYFGVWADAVTAVRKYLEQNGWLQAGQEAPLGTSGIRRVELETDRTSLSENAIVRLLCGLSSGDDGPRKDALSGR
ncbi:MAG: hypothetical protein R3C18_16645 [Planctomycetaceae bacterium]